MEADHNRSLGSLRVQELLFIFDGWPEGTQVVQVSSASEILLAWKCPSPWEFNLETDSVVSPAVVWQYQKQQIHTWPGVPSSSCGTGSGSCHMFTQQKTKVTTRCDIICLKTVLCILSLKGFSTIVHFHEGFEQKRPPHFPTFFTEDLTGMNEGTHSISELTWKGSFSPVEQEEQLLKFQLDCDELGVKNGFCNQHGRKEAAKQQSSKLGLLWNSFLMGENFQYYKLQFVVVVLVFVCFSGVHPAMLHVEMEFPKEINNDVDVKIAQLMSNLCVVQQIFCSEFLPQSHCGTASVGKNAKNKEQFTLYTQLCVLVHGQQTCLSCAVNRSQQNLFQRLVFFKNQEGEFSVLQYLFHSSVPALPLGCGERMSSWPGVKNCSWRHFGRNPLAEQAWMSILAVSLSALQQLCA
ncbi:hypothetical protein EK904_008830, partial [Melospiza melodia maxima]